MSIGYGGYMDLAADDNTTLIYTYCCYNVNSDDYKKYMELADGEIVIAKNALIEPEICSKKIPGSRKSIIKERIRREIPLEELFASGMITVKNAAGTWCTNSDGIDIMAVKMLFKLFNEYRGTGKIPKHIGWFS